MFKFPIITSTPIPQKSIILLGIEYEAFQYVFNKNKATSLPKHQPYDCPIDLNLREYEPPYCFQFKSKVANDKKGR